MQAGFIATGIHGNTCVFCAACVPHQIRHWPDMSQEVLRGGTRLFLMCSPALARNFQPRNSRSLRFLAVNGEYPSKPVSVPKAFNMSLFCDRDGLLGNQARIWSCSPPKETFARFIRGVRFVQRFSTNEVQYRDPVPICKKYRTKFGPG
jgi:hypothetical protein